MIRLPVPQMIVGALGLFFGLFVLWAALGNDPFGGEPLAVAPVHMQSPGAAGPIPVPAPHQAAAVEPAGSAAPVTPAGPAGPGRYDGPLPPQSPVVTTPAGRTTTVNIINGATGAREQVTIPSPGSEPPPGPAAAAVPPVPPGIDPKFVEMTPQGLVPKIAADGVRPDDAFAQPVKAIAGKAADAPRIALIVGGLGVSAKATAEAIDKLPGPVSLAFIPYGTDGGLVAHARAAGHEVLLQVPMEPFDYPDNDPGPQTLLTSLAPPQNLERLYWLMSRFQGYVGLISMMGARFTASEQAFSPVLRETAKRGLVFVDDGSNPRSVASRIAGANNLPFARADIILDSVPTPGEIDRALGRLETAARERHVVVGFSSALPVSIAHIAKWAKAAESRGIVLVPITAVAVKAKQS